MFHLSFLSIAAAFLCWKKKKKEKRFSATNRRVNIMVTKAFIWKKIMQKKKAMAIYNVKNINRVHVYATFISKNYFYSPFDG